jgi:SAM-dependent methyltransferase
VPEQPEVGGHYGAHYREFADEVYSALRRAEFGDDFGQNNWLTLPELERFASQLELGEGVRLLDVACGAGGPALHLAELTGCAVTGVDVEQNAIANAGRLAAEAGLEGRARFVLADASKPLPLGDASFEAILCLDALNHLPGRRAVFADWARLLARGGRLLFTDPVTVTGLVGSAELAIRSSIGYFDFAPPGEDERLLRAAGLNVLAIEDTTASMAGVARRRLDVRAERAETLKRFEGDEAFERRQQFLEIVAMLADERRISRFTYLAEKPSGPVELISE